MSWLYKLQQVIWTGEETGCPVNWFCLSDGAYEALKDELRNMPSVEDPSLDPKDFRVFGRPVFKASDRPDLVPPEAKS